MLNEPNPAPVPAGAGGIAGGGMARGVADETPGGSHMRYIQVTPQEKEAIERVRRSTALSYFHLVQSSETLQSDTHHFFTLFL